MGHLFLDAYHATGDEFYYQAAEQVAGALIWGQHPSGGWNYVVDFAGDRSLREWYATVGRNAWRLEEFQHYWGNATFDDGGTAEASKLLLRLYVEKRDPRYKPALDRAIAFVLDSQYPIGAWPQRFPLQSEFSHHGKPDYTLVPHVQRRRGGGEHRLPGHVLPGAGRRAVARSDRARHDAVPGHAAGRRRRPAGRCSTRRTCKPAGARTYEPRRARDAHDSARNVELLIRFYRLTGETKFLAPHPGRARLARVA